MNKEEIKKLNKAQSQMNLKYPDAKGFNWEKFDGNEKCPFCHKEMNLDIYDDPWYFDNEDEEREYPLLSEPAIGIGENKVRPSIEGDYDGYYTIYYKCPHCGQIFFIKFDV